MQDQNLLELERKKLQEITANIQEGIILIDNANKISWLNKAAEVITGYGITEAINQPTENIIKISDNTNLILPDRYCRTAGIETEGEIYRVENVMLSDKKNENKTVNFSSRSIKGGPSINLGCIVILENVSSQTEFERMKLDFMSMAVHTLRTPLTILRGFLSYLVQENTLKKLNENEIDYLSKAVESTDGLISLIENLFILSEIQKGSFTLNRTAIDIENIIREIVNEFRDSAESKGLFIKFIPGLEKLPLAYCDIIKIKEVLRNLVGNAIKYTDEGGIQIQCLLAGNLIQTSVTDTGVGIPAENIQYIFTKFYRIKEALEMESGSGLGLFISKKVIEAHGGEIWVDSIEGKGSTFYFTLPPAK